jgi:hypothetical protein
MIEAEMEGVKFNKKWLTRLDGNERPTHADANEQTREPSQPFSVGGEPLMFPGDPRGSAGNVINCRCQMITEIIET